LLPRGVVSERPARSRVMVGIPLAGRTFDPLDYVAYAAGVALGLALERWLLYRAVMPVQ